MSGAASEPGLKLSAKRNKLALKRVGLFNFFFQRFSVQLNQCFNYLSGLG